MLALALHFMRGTPYIYQGEEIGMTNNYFGSIDLYQDVESLNYTKILKEEGKSGTEILKILGAKSRDNARSPMQWNDQEFAGFSDTKPWIEINPSYKTINVQASMKDPHSIYAFYKKLIQIRKQNETIQNGRYVPFCKDHPFVYAYKREGMDEEIYVLCNFYGTKTNVELDLQELELLLSNYPDRIYENGVFVLRPYEAIAVKKSR
ncbi:hypothetical protein BO225_06845 [Dubosiella newyorkensis]|uniref:Uncharacterized protein n=2 Tax=Dubosiella newyorkensis TaxID=1862672 RepID=A0A1U7NM33_9FIRM|nr:hypothetical protein BO225_06845 [Dubosiella newyorkensis]